MKIAVLNECFFNDKHLEKLKKLGDLTVFKDTKTAGQAIERLKGVDIAIVDCFIAPLDKEVLESTDSLKFLSINSTGYDLVDLNTATQKNIKVANVPGFSTDAVAEHAIALMLAVNRKIPLGDNRVRENPFEIDPGNNSHREFLGFNVRGKTLGIIGLGKIGTRVAELGLGLGMKVIAHNRTWKQMDGVEMVSLEEVLSRSDVVSINLALSPELENLISEKELSMMKPSAILINTARGKHIKTTALYEALKSRRIAGAGIDALAEWDKNNPLLTLENVVLTPHSAFFTQESLENMADIIVSNVESFINGNPQNIVH